MCTLKIFKFSSLVYRQGWEVYRLSGVGGTKKPTHMNKVVGGRLLFPENEKPKRILGPIPPFSAMTTYGQKSTLPPQNASNDLGIPSQKPFELHVSFWFGGNEQHV